MDAVAELLVQTGLPDRGGRNLHPELEQLAPNPHVAPPGVLSPKSLDQLSDLGVESGASRRAVRPGPLPGDELSVPTQERLWPNQERTPRFPHKRPARGREERLVGYSVDRPLHLPAEDHDLVSEDGDLELRLGRCAHPTRTRGGLGPAGDKGESRSRRGIVADRTAEAALGPRSGLWTPRAEQMVMQLADDLLHDAQGRGGQ